MTFIFFALFFLLMTALQSVQVKAATTDTTDALPQVLIINQVRGQECCQPGRLETFKQQLEFFESQQLPAVFTLRYDVLLDPAYQEVIMAADQELFTWGLFLEVIPSLATAAEVDYLGNQDNWYEAQHAYTLGYTPPERQQLVDELVKVYYDLFQTYPTVTTSWILDTPTVNYLHDEYQVQLHQITREQWGTDSYTLYGGPPHYPYFASKNWAFMPGKVGNSAESMLIVRQTLTDPVWNYGDTQSRFTSQPNDFMQDGKDFSYFQQLLEQALFQQPAQQKGFALLGLENSMPAKYQKIFQQQLELVATWAAQQRLILPSPADLIERVESSSVKVYQGRDFVKNQAVTAVWIRGQNYRLRLLQKDQQVMIDDLRLYSPDLEDYYAEQQAQLKAYWIAPFLLDGSRFYSQEKTWFRDQQAGSGLEPLPDVVTTPQAWVLPELATVETELKYQLEPSGQLVISYQTQEGNFALRLAPMRFGLSLGAAEPPREAWNLKQAVVYELKRSCDREYCWYQPEIDAELFAQAQQAQRDAFLPEQQVGELDAERSQLYAHNPYAVAGKNPVRLVFFPRDEQGLAVQLEQSPEIIVEAAEVKLETDPESVLSTSPQFYDFSSQKPLKITITFKVADQLKLTTQVHFAPNCKTDWSQCWQEPRYLWWYTRSWLSHKRQLIEEKWQNWRNY